MSAAAEIEEIKDRLSEVENNVLALREIIKDDLDRTGRMEKNAEMLQTTLTTLKDLLVKSMTTDPALGNVTKIKL